MPIRQSEIGKTPESFTRLFKNSHFLEYVSLLGRHGSTSGPQKYHKIVKRRWLRKNLLKKHVEFLILKKKKISTQKSLVN